MAGIETKCRSHRWHVMMKWLLILLIPLMIQAESVFYGEDPFVLGVSIDALALGNIKALPMLNPSPGSNSASLLSRPLRLSFQHTEGFGGVYQTDVVTAVQNQWSLLVFRGGVSGIADTRHALLDHGTDGLPDTNDGDGTEGNGIMDPGERLSINSISYFSTQQWLAELGYNHIINTRLAIHGTARLLYHDLYTESGLGLGFHAGVFYTPFSTLRLGAEITDILTTSVFWSSGLTEVYTPELLLGADYTLKFSRIPFALHPVLQIEVPLAGAQAGLANETWGSSGGLEIIFQDQLYIQLGRNALGQFQVGAMIRTRYLDLQYGTGFSELTKTAGQTHRVGVGFHLDALDLF